VSVRGPAGSSPAGAHSADRSVKLAGAMSSLSEIRRVLADRDYRFLWLADSAQHRY
jgi:hypothetical protein